MGTFGKMFYKLLAGVAILFLIGFIVWLANICPQVLQNLSIDPNASEILGGFCKSISNSASKMPTP